LSRDSLGEYDAAAGGRGREDVNSGRVSVADRQSKEDIRQFGGEVEGLIRFPMQFKAFRPQARQFVGYGGLSFLLYSPL
jgi:hypothetical protein